jgi:subtilisin family serine protease
MKVAILDSGVHGGHPHVGRIQAGFDATGMTGDWVDRTGHGTAVAGAIRSHAPEAEFYAVKIFSGGLRTSIEIVLRGLEWALEQGVDVINLSLGTENPEHAQRFGEWVKRGAIWVSAAGRYPGLLEGVVSVEADAALERDQWRWNGPWDVCASPYPREIPGVARERNLSGVSFAVANVSGLIAARGWPPER